VRSAFRSAGGADLDRYAARGIAPEDGEDWVDVEAQVPVCQTQRSRGWLPQGVGSPVDTIQRSMNSAPCPSTGSFMAPDPFCTSVRLSQSGFRPETGTPTVDAVCEHFSAQTDWARPPRDAKCPSYPVASTSSSLGLLRAPSRVGHDLYGFGDVGDSQFLQDVGAVRFDGPGADAEAIGGLLGRQPLSGAGEDFALARGERVRGRGIGIDGRADVAPAGGDPADGATSSSNAASLSTNPWISGREAASW
jgi:hypothetical protein